jgi:hypothetical protein
MLMIPVMGNTGAAAGAAAAAAIAQAVKASGTIVRVEPQAFESVLRKQELPLVVHCLSGVFSRKHRYLSSYKGLAFYTQSADPLELPTRCELVEARSFWMPG